MDKNGIRGMAVLLLASCTHLAAHAQSPEAVPEAAQIAPAYDEAISYGESATCAVPQGGHGNSRLSRWWHGRVKPCLQYSHWGYPEYFEEVPFGASVRACQRAQICASWSTRLMLNKYDFCDGNASLNLHGQRRLNEIVASFPIGAHPYLHVEATPGVPQLDIARREYVAKVLTDSGFPALVEIGYPTEVSPFGDETRIVNSSLLRRVQRGRPIGGSSGGTGSAAAGSSGEGEQSQ